MARLLEGGPAAGRPNIAATHRSQAAALRTKMRGERSDDRLRELERLAADHDRQADEAGLADEGAEVLIDGQEEVFARAELETGVIEHDAEAGDASASSDGSPRP